MVLVPSYVDVDGLVVPLRVDPEDRRGPAVVRVRHDPARPQLEGFKYVINAMLARAATEPWIERLERRERLPLPQEISAAPTLPERFDYSEDSEQWMRLTGRPVDLSDAYAVGANFVATGLVVPRETFIKLVRTLIDLDAAVIAGRVEPKIDESMVVPPPLPEPEKPVIPWDDDDWQSLEEKARQLDELDRLTDGPPEWRWAAEFVAKRRHLFDYLDIAWLRTMRGQDDMPTRCRELGLTTLLAYHAATDAMLAYVHDPERLSIIEGPVPKTPYTGDVSIDVFRLPATPHPPGLSRHAWLAWCEAFFVKERGAPEKGAGDLFTRIGGHRVRLRYRPESTTHLMLWRVELV